MEEIGALETLLASALFLSRFDHPRQRRVACSQKNIRRDFRLRLNREAVRGIERDSAREKASSEDDSLEAGSKRADKTIESGRWTERDITMFDCSRCPVRRRP